MARRAPDGPVSVAGSGPSQCGQVVTMHGSLCLSVCLSVSVCLYVCLDVFLSLSGDSEQSYHVLCISLPSALRCP
jgi:hypothetical protein